MTTRTWVRLYVAGDAPNSVAAVANLRGALAAHADHGVELEIVDVVADPDRGLSDGILVTPMLVKHMPAPERRILGTLDNGAMLRRALGLAPGER